MIHNDSEQGSTDQDRLVLGPGKFKKSRTSSDRDQLSFENVGPNWFRTEKNFKPWERRTDKFWKSRTDSDLSWSVDHWFRDCPWSPCPALSDAQVLNQDLTITAKSDKSFPELIFLQFYKFLSSSWKCLIHTFAVSYGLRSEYSVIMINFE